jgi:hypothetical protein
MQFEDEDENYEDEDEAAIKQITAAVSLPQQRLLRLSGYQLVS